MSKEIYRIIGVFYAILMIVHPVDSFFSFKSLMGMKPAVPAAPKVKPTCRPVTTKTCDQYHFNQTVFPFENFLGHKSVQEADDILAWMFQQVRNCSIPREVAHPLACAIYIPLCLPSGDKFPLCSEDCIEMITTCKVNQIPGYEEALGLCTIFPARKSGKKCLQML